jgi:endonuclease V-like protein UPF0215 family
MGVRVEGPQQIQNAETANVKMGGLPVLQVGEDLVGSGKSHKVLRIVISKS